MGRVSKHKKIKPCDPFYKGPRRTHVRKGDFPPSNDDEQLPPKALLRLFKPLSKPKKTRREATEDKGTNLKKQEATVKNARKTKGQMCDPSASLIEKERENEISREGSSLKGRSAMFVRRPGETTRAYLERIDMESKLRISESLRKGKKSDRRERNSKRKAQPKLVITEEDLFKDFGDLKGTLLHKKCDVS